VENWQLRRAGFGPPASFCVVAHRSRLDTGSFETYDALGWRKGMLKVSSWKRLHGLIGAAALAGALLAAGAARPAAAQLACYQQSAYLLDTCGTSATGRDYEFNSAHGGFYAFTPDGPNDYLIFCELNDLTIYGLASPLAPTTVASTHVPWDWSSINTGGDTHGPYKSHLTDVATTGGFRYAIVSMGEYGWDFLRISGGARGFLGTGYHPQRQLNSFEYMSTALFSDGSATYAVAQKLDQASITSSDTSIKIYRIGTATDLTPGLSSATMTPLARVPTDASFPTPMNVMRLSVANFNGRRLLFALRRGAGPGVAIVDITDPANPMILNTIVNDSLLLGGRWAVDEGHATVWVTDTTHPIVHAYKIVQTVGIPGLSYQGPLTWWGTGTESVPGAAVSVAGNLLVAGAGYNVGYVSLAGGAAVRLPPAVGFTDIPPRTCVLSSFSESVSDLCAFQVAGQHYAFRSKIYSTDIVAVNSSCISTVPLPDFVVTGGSASASCVPPVGYTQADTGFPGDTFAITDASAGVWTTATLEIRQTPTGAPVASFQITNYGQTVTWTPPATTAPGDYYVVLSIAGGTPPSTTKVISLCGNPQASLAISQGSAQMLVGESVNVSAAATSGHPNGYTFYVVPTGQQLPGNGTTLAQAFTLPAKNTYTFGVVAHYDFAATDTGCGGVNQSYLINGNYDSCATVAVTAGYGVSSFVVLQNGQQIAPPQNGSLLVNQPTVLKFTGKIASSRTPNFVWSIPNGNPAVPSHLSCQFTAWPYTDTTCGPIAANTWTAGNPFTMNMNLQVCDGAAAGTENCGGTPADTITSVPSVTVTPTLNSIGFSANKTSVNVGETVTITLGQLIPATGYSSLLIDFGGMSCDGVRQKPVSCANIFGQNVCTQGSQVATFSYDASEAGTTKQVTITGTLTGGGTVPSTPLPITVGTSGTCPCPNVTATISGPNTAQPNQSVGFSASASAGTHGIASYSWTFGDGGTASGASVSHTWTSAGTYQVQVTATSDCGTSGTGTSTIVIGGGGGGNLTITPSPATPDPGTAVTFTFSPGVSVAGDSVTFNFGDGTPASSLNYISFCTPTAPCRTILHTYAAAGTFTVTAGGKAGGISVSGSTQVVVRNNCQLPSKPTAAFSWQPTQVLIGQVVQFHDDSTGNATAWSWDFGGPGVSGSSIAQAAAVALAGALTITPSNPTPNAGQQVTFTFSPAVTVGGDSVTFNFGDGTPPSSVNYISFCSSATPCGTTVHTYAAAGTFTVTATGTASGVSVAGSTTVVVGTGGGSGTFTITASPASPVVGQNVAFTFSPTVSTSGDAITITFGDSTQATVSYPCTLGACGATHSYAAAGAYTVGATGTAGGASVSGSTTVVVSAGGGGSGSNLQHPAYTYTAAGTYTVTLTATNCQGSSTTTHQIVVQPACTQTVAPVPDFTWGPTGPMPGFPEQQQPYAGQQVTLTDHSTNEPSIWHWYDFQEDLVDATVTTPTFTHAWTHSGPKNVRMAAANCADLWSAEVMHTIQVFVDVRHVIADFSWSPSDVSTGANVTFTAAQGPDFGDPTDFAWTFDDGSTQTGASVTYSFKCGGARRVTLTAARGSTTGTVTKSVTVAGTTCGPESVMGVDAAKIQGLNDTNWHADVRIYNPSAFPTSITLQFLPVGTNNVDPFTVGPYQPPVAPKGTLVLDDILQWLKTNFGQDFSKTALRFTYRTDDNVAPVVTIRTYNLRPDGSKYGQINSGVNVVAGSTLSPQWITGLRNNGLDTGFRTNYSIVNLRGDAGGVSGITFTLFDETGQNLGSKTFGLAPFGYIQDSIKSLFGPTFENIGTFSLKIEVPAGEDVQTYASVMDNLTGDPVMIPASTPPDSPIYLPAIAHLSGEANTVWRSDLQLTNPDGTGPHTWEIRYTPKGTDLAVVARQITLAPEKSIFVDDLVSSIYEGSAPPLPADAQTSGIVRIAPVDGTNVYPIVAARSYNLTATGTFGQGIPPLWAVKGVSGGDATRLVLTGMSSEDISRTNLGFVNLSETQGVNFVVTFYDESGNVLNPLGIDGKPTPYTFAIPAGTWDQDKLENRFRNAFKVALPAGLRAITAEIAVNAGGPGFAYATVIDTLTGDPNFIPAQLSP
jgi:PKD repeat protein